MFPVESPAEVRSVLSIGLTNDIQSPTKDPRLKTKHISAQVSDSHGNISNSNEYDVHQMDTPREVSCSRSAVERNEGQVKRVSTAGREPSVTAERRAHTSAAEMASETSTLIPAISTGTEPLPSNGQRDGRAAESRRKIVNSAHSTKQDQEKHGKEGVWYRDRHQKETREGSRHLPRSVDRRSDHRRHGNRDSRKKDHHHRNHHRREQKNGVPGESKSNRTQREHSRYHSSHRDRDRNRDRDYDHRDRDRERDEGSAFQGRQLEPGQNKMRPDTRFPSTTTTSLDKIEVSNEDEIHSNNGLETDTQDPVVNSLIENNGRHNAEYFVKLCQQERQLSKPVTSPAETGWSPAEREWSPAEIEWTPTETTASPNEATVTRIPNLRVSTRVETTVGRVPNPGVSGTPNRLPARIPKPMSSSKAVPLPSTLNATHPNAPLRRTSGAAASSFRLSSGPDTSQPFLGGNRSLDRRGSRGELDPGAQRALDKVRERYPPVKGPPVIPVTSGVGGWNLHGGSRKRKAHAEAGDVSSLRQRASSSSSSPPRRPAVGPARKKIQGEKKKLQEHYRGRKNWK